jgi:hypothetical protein
MGDARRKRATPEGQVRAFPAREIEGSKHD